MPSVAERPRVAPGQNIFIAASDGDAERVVTLLSSGDVYVNGHDANGYTILHAAASYGHLELLRLLVREHGGDINLEDFEGDTPLYVVEDRETARVIVEELGGDTAHRNKEGLTALEYLVEEGDFPDVVAYLSSVTPQAGDAGVETPQDVSGNAEGAAMQYEMEAGYSAEQLDNMDGLPAEVRAQIAEILSKTEEDGIDRDDQLRQLLTTALAGRSDILDAVVTDADTHTRETSRRREE
ncbi:hypothetical protein PYCC9005_005503 [Savitreella phatthalungensis]